MSSDTLPSELWTHIAGFCRQRDLHSLSTVNLTALYAVRPILFRKVVITQQWVKQNPSFVRNLLQRDLSSFQSVTQVRLVENKSDADRNTCKMMLDLLRIFKSAHSMILMGWPFWGHRECEKEFLNLMCTGQWRSFCCPHGGESAFPVMEFDDKGWDAITGLTQLTLGTATLLNGASNFIRASASTITRLIFSRMIDVADARSLQLLINANITFPQLLHFECTVNRRLFKSRNLPGSSILSLLITRFLRLHPTIQHLCLLCGNGYCYFEPECALNPALINGDFLPNLRIIEADINTVSTLAYRAKSMDLMEEVITGDWTNADQPAHLAEARAHMDICLSRILISGVFVNTKRFTMLVKDLNSTDQPRITVAQMEKMAKAFPFVEEWTGNESGLRGASKEQLVDMFKSFKHLREVRFQGVSSDAFRARIVKSIPQAVSTLLSIYCEALGSSASRPIHLLDL